MRVIQNHTGIENREYKVYQAKEALTDPLVWMLCANSFLQCIPGGGLTSFGKIIIAGLGFSNRQAIVMSFPSDGILLAANILAGCFAQIVPNSRIALMILTNSIVLIGSVLIRKLPASESLGPLYIMYVNTIPYILCMGLVSSNIGGFTKKATCGVMMFMSYAVGQIIAPQFFIASQAPTYPTGFRALYAALSLMILVEIMMLFYLLRQNRKKDKAAATALPQATFGVSPDFMDLTDKEHPDFQYVL